MQPNEDTNLSWEGIAYQYHDFKRLKKHPQKPRNNKDPPGIAMLLQRWSNSQPGTRCKRSRRKTAAKFRRGTAGSWSCGPHPSRPGPAAPLASRARLAITPPLEEHRNARWVFVISR